MDTQVGYTLEWFIEAMGILTQAVEASDPAGVNWSLRLAAGYGLYAAFDALRCREVPLDREVFAERIRHLHVLVSQCPPVQGQAQGGARRHPEELVAELYSTCWDNYDDRLFSETIDLFEERFRINDIRLEFLRGAMCLDAGCGSGRYTMAMARLGAARSIGIDISDHAIKEAEKRSQRLGFGPEISFTQGSVIAMPQDWSERFDFVCSNGVVHHTTDPIGGLREIFRVLKPGGRAYVFVYGAGGLFWSMVDVVRGLVALVPMPFAERWMESLGVPPGKMFNFMDHWYTPLQERVTRQELEARLSGCGFQELVYMARAKVYDASERRYRFPEERDLVGEGDLRYMVRKPR